MITAHCREGGLKNYLQKTFQRMRLCWQAMEGRHYRYWKSDIISKIFYNYGLHYRSMYGNMDIDRRHRKCYLMSLSLLGCTGERTVLAEYHFSSVHCDVIFHIKFYVLYWREMVLGVNWLHTCIIFLQKVKFLYNHAPQIIFKLRGFNYESDFFWNSVSHEQKCLRDDQP